jgi:protein gp37
MNDMRRRFPAVHKEEVQYHAEVLAKSLLAKKPKTIFWGSSFDLFADIIPSSEIDIILNACANSPKHNHVFLTKNPKRYYEFAHYKKLGNIFFGASTTGNMAFVGNGIEHIDFISVEPFIKHFQGEQGYIEEYPFTHIIIGGLTGRGNDPYKTTDYEAVVRLCKTAFATGKKVFIKDNLIKYAPLPVGIPYGIAPEIENFRQLPWNLYTKNVMDGAK